MSAVKPIFPFRIGTTSYIIPDEIIPNVRYLAGLVDDIELVLFEVDEGPNNLPDAAAIKELQSLAARHQLTYTVHLPLDLQLAGADGERHISLQKAQRCYGVHTAFKSLGVCISSGRQGCGAWR
jgi:sugar phosphate isomerase/epimerase